MDICKYGHSKTLENTYIDPQGRRKCRLCGRKTRAKYRKSEKGKQTFKERSTTLRLKVLAKYGGVCTHCGEDQEAVLEIDHVNGDGAQEREKIRGISWWGMLAREPIRKDLQVLCSGCNKAKERGKGMTNEQFAQKVGCDYTTASRLRNGQRLTSVSVLVKIADEWDLDLEELVRVHDSGKENFGEFLRLHVFSQEVEDDPAEVT